MPTKNLKKVADLDLGWFRFGDPYLIKPWTSDVVSELEDRRQHVARDIEKAKKILNLYEKEYPEKNKEDCEALKVLIKQIENFSNIPANKSNRERFEYLSKQIPSRSLELKIAIGNGGNYKPSPFNKTIFPETKGGLKSPTEFQEESAPCPHCGGNAEYLSCEECDGSGGAAFTRRAVRSILVRCCHDETCVKCGGQGQFVSTEQALESKWRTCAVCKGLGTFFCCTRCGERWR